MTFNDPKGLLAKAMTPTEETLSAWDSFLNDLINDMHVEQMTKRMLDNERRANMPTSCRTCSIVYQTNNPACRACMRKRDEEAKRNYYTRTNLKIKNVIFNPPATIVFWEDNTKTVVKAANEVFDPEKGLAMAFMKKALGNQGNYFNTVKKWTEKYYEAPVLKFDGGEMGLEAQKAFGIDLSQVVRMLNKANTVTKED